MQKVNLFLFLMIISSCSGNHEDAKADQTDRQIVEKTSQPFKEADSTLLFLHGADFTDFTEYRIADTISIDLTGDGFLEKAYLSDSPRHLYIIDGQKRVTTIVGKDQSFQGIADDLSWVDFWGITKDKVTRHYIVKDNEIVDSKLITLQHTSLVLMAEGEEGGGGVVTNRGGVYKWIHQAE